MPRINRIQTVDPSIESNKALKKPILILTAVPVELMAVLSSLKPLPKRRSILRTYIGQETYYFGILGSAVTVVTMCDIGAIGGNSAILATLDAIKYFSPKAIIMVGIAYGKTSKKQNIGDVLVASQIISYEPERIGRKRDISRGPISETSPILLNRFRNSIDWNYIASDGKEKQYFIGPLLSGEKLIDNLSYKAKLFKKFPQAIGGDMESIGLYTVASKYKIEWIVVKGISDWADGSKNDTAQPLAAASAISLVAHILKDQYALDAL